MIAAPPIALAVSPPRVVIAPAETRAVRVTNTSSKMAVVEAQTSGYAVTLRGRPVVLAGSAPVALRPRRLTIPPGGTATVAVTAAAAAPRGDRAALVLVGTRAGSVGVRVGVVVVVRGRGAAVHRVVAGALHARGRSLELSLQNLGTTVERIAPTVRFYRGGRLAGVARARARDLLPRSRGIVVFAIPRQLHGAVIARVRGRTVRLTMP